MPPSVDLSLHLFPGFLRFPGNQGAVGLPLHVTQGTQSLSKLLQLIFSSPSGPNPSQPALLAPSHRDSPRALAIQSCAEKPYLSQVRFNYEQAPPFGTKPQAGSLGILKIRLFSGTTLVPADSFSVCFPSIETGVFDATRPPRPSPPPNTSIAMSHHCTRPRSQTMDTRSIPGNLPELRSPPAYLTAFPAGFVSPTTLPARTEGDGTKIASSARSNTARALCTSIPPPHHDVRTYVRAPFDANAPRHAFLPEQSIPRPKASPLVAIPPRTYTQAILSDTRARTTRVPADTKHTSPDDDISPPHHHVHAHKSLSLMPARATTDV